MAAAAAVEVEQWETAEQLLQRVMDSKQEDIDNNSQRAAAETSIRKMARAGR